VTTDLKDESVQTRPMGIPVARLNHAVLYVRDATKAADFYGRVFGFEVVESAFGGRAVFMRSANGENHHDLGLFSVGPDAPRPQRGSVGLYHLAWEVPTISSAGVPQELLGPDPWSMERPHVPSSG
jgi:catechol-2,3-dioxygenase